MPDPSGLARRRPIYLRGEEPMEYRYMRKTGALREAGHGEDYDEDFEEGAYQALTEPSQAKLGMPPKGKGHAAARPQTAPSTDVARERERIEKMVRQRLEQIPGRGS